MILSKSNHIVANGRISDDMVLYIENSKVSIIKLLELINEFGKFAGYKVNI